MAGPRIEKLERTVRCKNPECGREFTTKKYGRKVGNQEHCSRKCRQQHYFLRKVAKKRTEAIYTCRHCGKEQPVRVTPA